ncbi:MAG: hypothetical protein H7239_01655 [Flavobacterium sp.]|nr:hypothetical protein [Flavobacterium sp.]
MKKIILILAIALSLASCKNSLEAPAGNNFYFENPQPINDSELATIPAKFLGNYINADSIKLSFTNNFIIAETRNNLTFHKNEMDSLKKEFKVVNGKYILKSSGEIFESKNIGDSIELRNKKFDTIFKFSPSQKAKRINGNLILNQKDSIYWKIKLISLNKNKLTIKQLYSNSDLKSLDSITKIHSKKIDSLNYIISPSRGEFKKFLQLKNFGFNQEFVKLKNP